MLINNDTYQRETLSEQPIRQPLKTYEDYNRYLESYNFSACLVFYFINVYTLF